MERLSEIFGKFKGSSLKTDPRVLVDIMQLGKYHNVVVNMVPFQLASDTSVWANIDHVNVFLNDKLDIIDIRVH